MRQKSRARLEILILDPNGTSRPIHHYRASNLQNLSPTSCKLQPHLTTCIPHEPSPLFTTTAENQSNLIAYLLESRHADSGRREWFLQFQCTVRIFLMEFKLHFCQRSGYLSKQQRATWRSHSALEDGKDAGLDLSGGYYDAGDNVKFGFPMAFTVTLLAWSAIDFEGKLAARNELKNLKEAIKWGTDYFIKAHPEPEVFFAQVGDGHSDHQCWQRPEDMTTPRTSYRVDASHPGSDLVAETAAALAASSMVFKKSDAQYSHTLLSHARQLFDFGRHRLGVYSASVQVVNGFYTSSGYEDELLWAATWLYRATHEKMYLDFIKNFNNIGGVRSQFSWDDKFVGPQVLVSKLILDEKVKSEGKLSELKQNGENFICNAIQKGSSNLKMTPGGLLWTQYDNNLQYTAAASLVISVYADTLAAHKTNLHCPGGSITPEHLINFVRKQADYILGANPQKISYFVGFGNKFPQRVHHRGASMPSIKEDPNPIACREGFDKYLHVQAPNPNVLIGALVGGPNDNDGFNDDRDNSSQNEPATANTAPFVGVLARLA